MPPPARRTLRRRHGAGAARLGSGAVARSRALAAVRPAVHFLGPSVESMANANSHLIRSYGLELAAASLNRYTGKFFGRSGRATSLLPPCQ